MRLEGAGRARGGIPSALLRAGEFLADRGYVQGTIQATNGSREEVFRRGSRAGSLTGFSPSQWAANVSLRGLGVSGLKVVFEVNTTGQMVTQGERAFWDDELAGVLAVIEEREPILAPATRAPQAPPAEEGDVHDTWWGKLIGAVAFFGMAYYLNGEFTALESGARESIRIHSMLALLYENLGHQGTIGLLGFGGIVCTVLGTRQLLNR